MKVITLLNEKGGVGKTTLATHIAAGLAVKGHRVILVDSDPQGHATVMFGLPKEPGLYNLLVRDTAFRDTMRFVPPEQYQIPGRTVTGQLFIVPSNIETRNIANSISDAFAVSDRIDELEDIIDFVIFDTSPTPSLLHGSIYLATDFIIYPTKCEYLSFDGLVESIKHREAAQVHRDRWNLGPIEVLGIVPTMYRKQTVEHSENLKELRRQFGDLVWPPINQRTIWTEAVTMRQPVFAIGPETKAAAEALALVDRVLGALVHA
jgi:chromosome partitioning protein